MEYTHETNRPKMVTKEAGEPGIELAILTPEVFQAMPLAKYDLYAAHPGPCVFRGFPALNFCYFYIIFV